jgi:hypothetical protein
VCLLGVQAFYEQLSTAISVAPPDVALRLSAPRPLSHDPPPPRKKGTESFGKLPAEKNLFGAIGDPSRPKTQAGGLVIGGEPFFNSRSAVPGPFQCSPLPTSRCNKALTSFYPMRYAVTESDPGLNDSQWVTSG